MKTGKTILTITALLLAASSFAGEFSLSMISARDIAPSGVAVPLPVPALELSVLDEAEAASYLADREAAPEAEEKGAEIRQLGGDGSVKLYHQWTRESLEIRYRDERGRPIPAAMAAIRRFMRCRLTGREADIPAGLIEIIDALQDRHGGRTVTVICGYRSPELNSALASDSSGVAKKSLHMQGLAADIRIDGVRTSALRDAAKALRAGGVGYYPRDGFVHVDVGPVRYW
ncbi:MAG: YcbK family protein [Elusimicrobiales bacterium]